MNTDGHNNGTYFFNIRSNSLKFEFLFTIYSMYFSISALYIVYNYKQAFVMRGS